MAQGGSGEGPHHDTIVAIATPEGEGGLAVVRVSGAGARAIAMALFRPSRPGVPLASHRARHGLLVSAAGEALDEALVLPLLAPRSYTGEDTVEFHCHGGRLPARRVLDACVAAGARPAGPGEFTRRAFLNGRLSLDQAEAVADLIHAEDELTAGAALAQLRGGLRREVAAIEAPLRDLLADLEGSVEFGEAGLAQGVARERIAGDLRDACLAIDHLLALAPAARRLRDGVSVVLAGPPNSGKSSLFNALAGRERALVDAEPGTTRDVVSTRVRHGGLTFVLHDTAGLRPGGGRVESRGMALAREAIARADIVLWLRDLTAADPPGEGGEPAAGGGARLLRIGTKADLGDRTGALPADTLVTSARTGAGLEALKEALLGAADAAGVREVARAGLLLNARHQHRLMEAREPLGDLLAGAEAGEVGEEIVAGLLGAVLARLGEISGRVFTEQVLGDIFARFCAGK
ncbi:MAG: tRNA uridine-5-carboxymethylaminomethyl(34) synthesis GTPase MnmE [Candidatus Krumholzibacteriia bacterium]